MSLLWPYMTFAVAVGLPIALVALARGNFKAAAAFAAPAVIGFLFLVLAFG